MKNGDCWQFSRVYSKAYKEKGQEGALEGAVVYGWLDDGHSGSTCRSWV